MIKRMRLKKRFRMNDEEWDDDEFFDPDAGPDDVEVEGPSFAPMFTGILDSSGNPVLRHPVVVRMGFYREEDKYHTPTLDSGPYPGSDSIVGWVYHSG
jgi:hypothetical protein